MREPADPTHQWCSQRRYTVPLLQYEARCVSLGVDFAADDTASTNNHLFGVSSDQHSRRSPPASAHDYLFMMGNESGAHGNVSFTFAWISLSSASIRKLFLISDDLFEAFCESLCKFRITCKLKRRDNENLLFKLDLSCIEQSLESKT